MTNNENEANKNIKKIMNDMNGKTSYFTIRITRMKVSKRKKRENIRFPWGNSVLKNTNV